MLQCVEKMYKDITKMFSPKHNPALLQVDTKKQLRLEDVTLSGQARLGSSQCPAEAAMPGKGAGGTFKESDSAQLTDPHGKHLGIHYSQEC